MDTKVITPKKTSIIRKIIEQKETKGFVFKPSISIYEALSINRKRFAKLYRGDLSPTLEELRSVGSYFEADIKEFI
ncbi:MAG: hypothetical protein M3Q58_03405 [Bacteroidota bacterium]|nr:hypothetical protein [Bacteroidota bacterium]